MAGRRALLIATVDDIALVTPTERSAIGCVALLPEVGAIAALVSVARLGDAREQDREKLNVVARIDGGHPEVRQLEDSVHERLTAHGTCAAAVALPLRLAERLGSGSVPLLQRRLGEAAAELHIIALRDRLRPVLHACDAARVQRCLPPELQDVGYARVVSERRPQLDKLLHLQRFRALAPVGGCCALIDASHLGHDMLVCRRLEALLDSCSHIQLGHHRTGVHGRAQRRPLGMVCGAERADATIVCRDERCPLCDTSTQLGISTGSDGRHV